MTTCVALLYSVVLDTERRVSMERLREIALDVGFRHPRTLVSTGNLVFDSDDSAVSLLESRLEAGFAAAFGKHVDIVVRTAERWRQTVAGNPFPREAAEDGSRVIIRVSREPVASETVLPLQPLLTAGERIQLADGDLWAHFPGKPSQSRLLPALTPKRLGIGTSRNWNTVRRLGEMLD